MNPPNLIILEGPDGCGKTTLGRFLAKEFDAMYFHVTATKSLIPAMRDYQMNVLKNVQENLAMGRRVILDRHWPSELIYGKILRPTNPHGFSYTEMEEYCTKLGAIYVICTSQTAVLRHQSTKDPEHPYLDLQYQAIYEAYKQLWIIKTADLHYLEYDMETWMNQMGQFAKLLVIRNEYIKHRASQ